MFLNENIKEFEELIQTSPKIKVLKNQINGSDLEEIIKGLIRIKAEKRSEHKENNDNVEAEERHRIWGTTKKPPTGKNELPQGSKILPFIVGEFENGKLRVNNAGFLSVVGLLNLEGDKNV
jgi:CRISPR-associated protein Cmr1